MKNSNIVVWLLGVGLIVLACVLLSGYFSDLRILLLDGGVLLCVYSLFIYVYGGLYYDKEEFARDVPAAGVRIPALWLYATLVLAGIVAGYAAAISFSWQTWYNNSAGHTNKSFVYAVMQGLCGPTTEKTGCAAMAMSILGL